MTTVQVQTTQTVLVVQMLSGLRTSLSCLPSVESHVSIMVLRLVSVVVK